MDPLRPAETVIDTARRIAEEVRARLAPLLPAHELTLTGGSSLPGALTKGDVDLHLTVTPAGSEHDLRFRRGWELLRADPALLAAYNAMKAGDPAGYEERKSAFFTRLATGR